MLKFEWTKKHTSVLLYTCTTLLLSIAIVFTFLFPGTVTGFLKKLFSSVSTVFFGFVIAYLVSPVCDFYEKKVFEKIKSAKTLRILSVVCSFLTVFAVIGLFVGLLVPKVAESYLDLEKKLEGYVSNAVDFFNGIINEIRENDTYGFLSSFLGTDKMLSAIDGVLDNAAGFVGDAANTVLRYSTKILSVAGKVIVSFIFAIYFLIEKRVIFAWVSRLSAFLFSSKFNTGARKWISLTDEVFSSFISGKIVNALIITVVNLVVFSVFDIPYAPVIALVCGVTDMIPYFGPFIGAIPCAFIILIAEPAKVIWFAVLVLVIQQIDGNIVGPKILGEKVGVDSLLIIVAITVSGGLFGIAGMFVGVPVFTVIYNVAMEIVNSKLKKKGMSIDTDNYKKSKKEAV